MVIMEQVLLIQLLLTNMGDKRTRSDEEIMDMLNSATMLAMITPPAKLQGQPSNPTATSSGTGVMMGLNQVLTPTKTGKIFAIISGAIDNDTIGLGNGALVQLRYGTGTAPSNAGTVVGTSAGSQIRMVNPFLSLLAPGATNFNVQSYIAGLTVGNQYWFDLSLARIAGGTARVRDLSVTLIELFV